MKDIQFSSAAGDLYTLVQDGADVAMTINEREHERLVHVTLTTADASKLAAALSPAPAPKKSAP